MPPNDELLECIKALLNSHQPKVPETVREAAFVERRPSFELEPPAYGILQFCHAHNISRSTLYNSWKDGVGPRFFRVGKSVRISRESAAEWRAEREAATDQRSVADGKAA